MRLKHFIGCALLSAGSLLFLVSLAARGQAPAAAGQAAQAVRGLTRPSSEELKLSLKVADIVREVNVKGGDRVKKGDVLLVEDDREERIVWEYLDMEARSDVPIRQAQVTLKNRQVELQRLQELFRDKVAAPLEVDRAEAEAELAELEVEKAEMDQKLRQLQADRQAAVLEDMRIISPVDGIVKTVDVKVGEVVEPGRPAITLVVNDPLWVEVFIPTTISLAMQQGQDLAVRYVDTQEIVHGKVIFLDPVARTGERQIRLELPNPKQLPAGLQVDVLLPAAVAGAAAERN